MFKDVDVEIYGSGSRVQNYIDVRDIAEAIYKAVNNKANGLFLIAGRRSMPDFKANNSRPPAVPYTTRPMTRSISPNPVSFAINSSRAIV